MPFVQVERCEGDTHQLQCSKATHTEEVLLSDSSAGWSPIEPMTECDIHGIVPFNIRVQEQHIHRIPSDSHATMSPDPQTDRASFQLIFEDVAGLLEQAGGVEGGERLGLGPSVEVLSSVPMPIQEGHGGQGHPKVSLRL